MKLRTFAVGICALLILLPLASANREIPPTVPWILEMEKGEIKIGVAVRQNESSSLNSRNRAQLSHRADERFPMCSTFKLLAVGAVLQRVDQGKDKLDRFVTYTEKDLLEYAPITRQHVQEGGMKLVELCAAAIEQSDNTAGNLLLQGISGTKGFNEFVLSLRVGGTRLDRMEPELNYWTPGEQRDTTTPGSMCFLLELLLQTDLLSEQSRKLLDGWLQHNETGAALIRAGVPSGWRVGDKTGRSGNGATNDVAVIYPPDDAPIFVAIYAFGGSDEARSAAIVSVTRRICEIFRPAH